MDEYYNKSRVIMIILATAVSFIMFINEDISFKLYGTFFIVMVTLVVSYLVTPISKKMIERGDKIGNKFLRILYYIFMLPVLLLLVLFVCMVIVYIYDLNQIGKPESTGNLDEIVIVISLYVISFILFVVPYVQSLIVLLLKNKDKNSKK